MQQAAADKNVRNIFKFNSPGDPYSLLIGVDLGSDEARGDAVSPVHYVHRDNPPFLILHGTHDALVPFAQSVELTAALKAKGADALLQRIPRAGHGGGAFGKPAVAKLIESFFDKHLKGLDVKVELIPESVWAVRKSQPKTK